MENDFINDIVQGLPFGYALHQFVIDENGKPCDYIFLELNSFFEQYTGLSAAECIGKKVTEVLPNIKEDSFDWIKEYASVSYEGKKLDLEEYSNCLDRWYKVSAYSPRKGYFVTIITDISEEKFVQNKMIEKENDIKRQEVLMDMYNKKFTSQVDFLDYILEKAKELTQSEYVDVCLYNEQTQEFRVPPCKINTGATNNLLNNSTFESLKTKNLWSQVIHQREPLIFNNLNRNAEKSENLLKGYTKYKHIMSIPVIADNKIVAIADLGNQASEYTEMDANHIALLFQSAWFIQDQKALEDRIFSDQKKLAYISNKMGALICEFKTDSTITFVNKAYCKYFGKSAEELIGEKFLKFIPSEEKDIVQNKYLTLTPENPSIKYIHQVQKDNEIRWTQWEDMCIFDAKENPISYYSIGSDITEEKQLNDEQEKQLSQLNGMINGSQVVMLVIDPLSGEIVDANPAAQNFYGYDKNELLQMSIHDINILEDESINKLMHEANEEKKNYFTFSHRLKNKEIKRVDVYSSPIKYDDKNMLCSIIFDVTDRENSMREIKYLAFHDYLTGVYNRRYFEEQYSNLNKSSNFPLAVIMGDLNGLKSINDSLGHIAGDSVLKEVAKRMLNCIDKGNILARIGGDEFTILLSNTNEEDVKILMKSLKNINNCKFTLNAEEKSTIELSISFGYGIQKYPNDTLDDLMTEAESFMYRRKYYHSKSMKSNAIKAIMNILFEKSQREEKHSERVGLMCQAIAIELGWPEEYLNRIRIAGYLHDIGKITVDEYILNKPEKLNDNEWEKMKLHPLKSASILENTHEYKDIANIVLSHHERYDGTGYPRGLKGEVIPMESRIISVADAYDAMTDKRSYQLTKSQDEAILELKRWSGTQFDPEVVSVFINKVLPYYDFLTTDSSIISEGIDFKK